MLTVVGIADMAVLRGSGQIVTYALGSCVGVVGYDAGAKVAGLLHVLLPGKSVDDGRSMHRPATYADVGVPLLLESMMRLGAQQRSTRFKLAGGAAMLQVSDVLDIGRRNVMAVRKALYRLGLLVEAEAVGGTQPRTLSIDSATGTVVIKSPGRDEVTL